MSGSRILNDYFAWMYNMVCHDISDETYYELFRYLDLVEFEPLILMDTNRVDDGIGLRYRFGEEKRLDRDTVTDAFRGKPCSVLEMMIALAKRCEESIMSDYNLGDRTALWFWGMLDTLGLSDMDDSNFNALEAGHIMYIFMNRKYHKDGTGGLFKIHDDTKDMREIEIWYQMCFYLDEILNL